MMPDQKTQAEFLIFSVGIGDISAVLVCRLTWGKNFLP
jgi:hypothetical protein